MKIKMIVLALCFFCALPCTAKPKTYEAGKIKDIQTEQRLWLGGTTIYYIYTVCDEKTTYTGSTIFINPTDINAGDSIEFRLDDRYIYIKHGKKDIKLWLEKRTKNPASPQQE
jgi:hypothetical protein